MKKNSSLILVPLAAITALSPAACTPAQAQNENALQQAATAARAQGIEDFWVTSGWRSQEYQQQLLDDGIKKYGSAEEASKWVASPTASSHVSGKAVDVGPTQAADWLARKGSQFSLCQMYANEMRHYELRADAEGNCPVRNSCSACRRSPSRPNSRSIPCCCSPARNRAPFHSSPATSRWFSMKLPRSTCRWLPSAASTLNWTTARCRRWRPTRFCWSKPWRTWNWSLWPTAGLMPGCSSVGPAATRWLTAAGLAPCPAGCASARWPSPRHAHGRWSPVPPAARA